MSVRDGTVTDAELIDDGTWTEKDALARELLDVEVPGRQLPTRLAPMHRKFVREVRVGRAVVPMPKLSALFGLDYERRYVYVAALRAWVILNRDRPPTIIGDDPDWEPPVEPTDPAVYRDLERELERGLAEILEAARRHEPKIAATSP